MNLNMSKVAFSQKPAKLERTEVLKGDPTSSFKLPAQLSSFQAAKVSTQKSKNEVSRLKPRKGSGEIKRGAKGKIHNARRHTESISGSKMPGLLTVAATSHGRRYCVQSLSRRGRELRLTLLN